MHETHDSPSGIPMLHACIFVLHAILNPIWLSVCVFCWFDLSIVRDFRECTCLNRSWNRLIWTIYNRLAVQANQLFPLFSAYDASWNVNNWTSRLNGLAHACMYLNALAIITVEFNTSKEWRLFATVYQIPNLTGCRVCVCVCFFIGFHVACNWACVYQSMPITISPCHGDDRLIATLKYAATSDAQHIYHASKNTNPSFMQRKWMHSGLGLVHLLFQYVWTTTPMMIYVRKFIATHCMSQKCAQTQSFAPFFSLVSDRWMFGMHACQHIWRVPMQLLPRIRLTCIGVFFYCCYCSCCCTTHSAGAFSASTSV